MGQYDKAIAAASRLIKKFGKPVLLRRYQDAVLPDEERPWRRDRPAGTDEVVNAVFLNFGDLGRAGEQYLPGSVIEKGDKLVLLPGGDLEKPPALRDRLYRDGGGPEDGGWAVVRVQTLDPNGQQVLHQLQVRR